MTRRRCRSWMRVRCLREVPADPPPPMALHGGVRAEPAQVAGGQVREQAVIAVERSAQRHGRCRSSRAVLRRGQRAEAEPGGHRCRGRAGRGRGAASEVVCRNGHRDYCRHTARRGTADRGCTRNRSRSRRDTAPARRNRGWHSRKCCRSRSGSRPGSRWGSRCHSRMLGYICAPGAAPRGVRSGRPNDSW